MTDPGRLLGRGIAFPPHVGTDGRVAWSEGEANIRQAIQIVVLTEPGERPRLPAFGGGLGTVLFAPNTTSTRHDIGERIRRAVAEWEPRITVRSVEVAPDPVDAEAAIATLTYQLVATSDVGVLTLAIALKG
jgi:phage baseplate assembly protein W